MKLTIQILVEANDIHLLNKCISSVLSLNTNIVVGNLTQNNNIDKLCYDNNIVLVNFNTIENYSTIRNELSKLSKTDCQMYINSNEALVHGHQIIKNLKPGTYYCNVVGKNNIKRETRIWNKNQNRFKNPVFEVLDVKRAIDSDVAIYSTGDIYNIEKKHNIIKKWKENNPITADPYYYECFLLLNELKYDDFLNVSQMYMFKNPKINISSTMNKYYYAMISLIHTKAAKATIQNLAQCLSVNPLMAEFWCLAGDVYYHAIKDFNKAKRLYENAIFLGSKRQLNNDWPMDISKYQEYPLKMIESCNKILNSCESFKSFH